MSTKARSLFDTAIVRRALVDSFYKLDPRREIRNPVMFTVYVGSILTTGLWILSLEYGRRGTVVVHLRRLDLAVVHRAVCQFCRSHGRGARQGPGRLAAPSTARSARQENTARAVRSACAAGVHRHAARRRGDRHRGHRSAQRRSGDRRSRRLHSGRRRSRRRRRLGRRKRDHGRKRAGDPRKRRRSQRRHRRHARAVRLAHRAHHGQSRRNVSRSHDRHGRRRQAAEDAQRNRARHSAGRHDDHLSARVRHAAAVFDFQRRRGRPGHAHHGHRAGGAVGLPDSHDDRRACSRPSALPAWIA